MFGIKTRKDKEIEQLKGEVEQLQECLKSVTTPPQMISIKGNIVTLFCDKVLENEEPMDSIKRKMALDFAEKIMPHIEWEVMDRNYDEFPPQYPIYTQNSRKVLRGMINVVLNKWGNVMNG